MASEEDSKTIILKKKLQVFLGDLHKFSTTEGFKHFSCYIRGKEEVVISITNNLPRNSSHISSRKQSLRPSDSLNSANLPYDSSALTLSHNTQLGLSGLQEKGIGLPPASPSEDESFTEFGVTKFLIAGYARYSCPYVWVRSNHKRLMKISGESHYERDCPLRLKSTGRWHDSDVHAYEVIAELVKLSTYPPPQNPFELDFSYFANLTQPSQLLASATMLCLMDKQVMVMVDTKPYSAKVFKELQQLARLHFSSIQDFMQNSHAPIVKQHQMNESHQRKRSRDTSQHHCYPKPTLQPAIANANVPNVLPTSPINNGNSHIYGKGPGGVFPGGFERMPAPSMF